jgi:hypothetical protein
MTIFLDIVKSSGWGWLALDIDNVVWRGRHDVLLADLQSLSSIVFLGLFD